MKISQQADNTVEMFLDSVSETRKHDAQQLIEIMRAVSGLDPVMWGSSIIGFGTKHYVYDTGREGDVPALGFSPRKTAITIYFLEGFDRYGEELKKLGTFTHSVSCLYIKKLENIDRQVLQKMLEASYRLHATETKKLISVEEYIARIPSVARPQFDALRAVAQAELPSAQEVVSYGIVGYKVDEKRARVYISGWKDHVAMYPVPKSESLQAKLKPYIRGKGTLWFALNEPLPTDLIRRTIRALAA